LDRLNELKALKLFI